MATADNLTEMTDRDAAHAHASASIKPAPRFFSLRDAQRELDTILPGQCTPPANDRKLERRRD